jgi:hypothetical protein
MIDSLMMMIDGFYSHSLKLTSRNPFRKKIKRFFSEFYKELSFFAIRVVPETALFGGMFPDTSRCHVPQGLT